MRRTPLLVAVVFAVLAPSAQAARVAKIVNADGSAGVLYAAAAGESNRVAVAQPEPDTIRFRHEAGGPPITAGPGCAAGPQASEVTCSTTSVVAIAVLLADRDDRLDATQLPAVPGVRYLTAYGADGNDELLGSALPDALYGDAGADRLRGGPGINKLFGGDGNDDLSSTTHGGHLLEGGPGDDVLEGGPLADVLYGDAQAGTTGAGDDVMRPGPGDHNDTFHGGDGRDTVDYASRTVPLRISVDGLNNDGAQHNRGNVHEDVESVIGGAGDDVLIAASAGTALLGGGGDDTLVGRAGNDNLEGGSGDDVLAASTGADELTGGPGRDGLHGRGSATYHAGDGETDTIRCTAPAAALVVDAGDQVIDPRCEGHTDTATSPGPIDLPRVGCSGNGVVDDQPLQVNSPLKPLPAPRAGEPVLPLDVSPSGARRPPAGFADLITHPRNGSTARPFGTIEDSIAIGREIGADVVRRAFAWSVRWPDPDAPVCLEELDREYVEYSRAGVRLMWLLEAVPGWAAADPERCNISDPADARFLSANFCLSLVKREALGHYRRLAKLIALRYPLLAGIDVHNEPNTWYFGGRADPQLFGEQLRAAHEGIKSGRPAMRVYAPASTNHLWNVPVAPKTYTVTSAAWYFARALFAGGDGRYDAISLHPQAAGATTPDAVMTLRTLHLDMDAVSAAFGQPEARAIWSEFGVRAYDDAALEAQRADMWQAYQWIRDKPPAAPALLRRTDAAFMFTTVGSAAYPEGFTILEPGDPDRARTRPVFCHFRLHYGEIAEPCPTHITMAGSTPSG